MTTETFYRAEELKKQINTAVGVRSQIKDRSDFSHVVICAKDNTKNEALPHELMDDIVELVLKRLNEKIVALKSEFEAL